MRVAIVLFNLGGPESLEAVEPFLTNLFSDPAILRVPRKEIGRYPVGVRDVDVPTGQRASERAARMNARAG